MRRNEGHVTGRVINNVIVYEYKNRGIPRKRWMNCVNEDIYVYEDMYGSSECRYDG